MRVLAGLLAISAAAAMNPAVHAFYYLWYGTPEVDGRWKHWNHSVLPHWDAHIRDNFPHTHVSFKAPHDIHAPFYPARGPYSSADVGIIRAHLRDMSSHGMGVLVVSWWGRPGVSVGDTQGVNTDAIMPVIMEEAAAAKNVRVAFHLEPYPGRSVESVREDVAYLRRTYGKYESAWARMHTRGGDAGAVADERSPGLPLYYVYDSYHIPPEQWARMLTQGGDLTVRGDAELDGVFIGLWLQYRDGQDLAQAGFDGAYTYFAVDGFSYGSSTRNWKSMSSFLASRGMHFVPCVAPGYDDSKIRPWNAFQRIDREGGQYYIKEWEAALEARPSFVGITTFNEWGEGTQIEDAVPRAIPVDALAPEGQAIPRDVRTALRVQDSYSSYAPAEPDVYMQLTLQGSAYLARVRGDLRLASVLQEHFRNASSTSVRRQRLLSVVGADADRALVDAYISGSDALARHFALRAGRILPDIGVATAASSAISAVIGASGALQSEIEA